MDPDDLNDFFDPSNYVNVPVQPDDTGQPRYPFLFLLDVSASTNDLPAGATESDNQSLNAMMRTLFARLHDGPPGDPLELHRPNIDVAVVTYGETASMLMSWTRADSINPSPPPIDAKPELTQMGHGLAYAIGAVRNMQKFYLSQGLPKSGLPIIFHITDGGATDVKLGDAELQKLRQSIDTLNPGGEKPSRMVLYHFVMPNGYYASQNNPSYDDQGNHITGAELLARMFGKNHVMPLQDGVDSFNSLVKFIIRTISHVSKGQTPTADMLQDLMRTFRANPVQP